MKKFIIAALGVALGAASLNASAATDSTTTFSPSLQIVQSCSINSTGLTGAFANTVAGSNANGIVMATGTLVVVCPGVPYKVGANFGQHHSGDQRQLNNASSAGTKNIPYKLTVSGLAATSTDWCDVGLNSVDPSYQDTCTTNTAVSIGTGAASPGESFTIDGVTTSALIGDETGTFGDVVIITLAY